MRNLLVACVAVLAFGACKKEPNGPPPPAPEPTPAPSDKAPVPGPATDPKVDKQPEPVKPSEPAPPPEVAPFVSADGGYEIKFPDKPDEQTHSMPTAIGTLDLHVASVDQGDHAFMVMWQVQPKKAPKKAKDQLDGQREGMIAGMPGSKVLEQKDITLGSYPGREMKIQLAEPVAIEHVRVFVIDNRLFQVGMIAVGDGDPEAAKAFLDSFALTKK